MTFVASRLIVKYKNSKVCYEAPSCSGKSGVDYFSISNVLDTFITLRGKQENGHCNDVNHAHEKNPKRLMKGRAFHSEGENLQ